MKDRKMIILTSLLAVLICLIITVLLFYAVSPKLLVVLSFIIGAVTGVCGTIIIFLLIDKFRSKSHEKVI